MAKIGNIELGPFPLLLAPMEDVSDPPFRALCKEQGADVMYTEFISSEGLIRDAAKSVMIMIEYILLRLPNDYKMWVRKRFPFMGVLGHKCTKGKRTGIRLRR